MLGVLTHRLYYVQAIEALKLNKQLARKKIIDDMT